MKTSVREATPKRLRCAIYTRKSSEEGLDMEFNSLDAQRDACEAYVASQKAEGWAAIRERYDDGGYSGGSLERPALTQLVKDIKHGLVDVVVVYKIDRLSRSLVDFTRLVDVFDRHGVTFVSVTQSFNTTSSMGRLTLNILLSFAQFEREVIGERIRDKFSASRKRGMWMGGFVPLGYEVRDRKLVVSQAEAKVVRMIFERFASLGSATIVARVLRAENIRNKRGKHIDKGVIYRLINNRVYLGEAVYKGVSYPGEHEAIVSQQLWDAAHAVLKESPRARATKTRDRSPALLKGIIFSSSGAAMTPTFTRKGDRLYRYYVSMDHVRGRPVPEGLAPTRLPAAMVEATVVAEMRRMIATPEMAARILDRFQQENVPCDQRELLAELRRFNKLWDVLFPAERARIVRLLVARVTVDAEGLQIDLRHEGLTSLARDLMAETARGVDA
jgi:DNA invertase Pin-like site-specific DNA recombinase